MPDYVPNITTLRDLVIAQFGRLVVSHPVDSDYNLTTTAANISNLRNQKIGLIASNTGANNCAISFSQNVTITTGILLQPGAALILNWFYDFDWLFKPLYAVAAAGNTTLHVIENQLIGG